MALFRGSKGGRKPAANTARASQRNPGWVRVGKRKAWFPASTANVWVITEWFPVWNQVSTTPPSSSRPPSFSLSRAHKHGFLHPFCPTFFLHPHLHKYGGTHNSSRFKYTCTIQQQQKKDRTPLSDKNDPNILLQKKNDANTNSLRPLHLELQRLDTSKPT
jgi:hypothetical protein